MASQDLMRVMVPEAGELMVKSPRVATMIKFVVNNERRIGSMPKGKLMFGFSGAVALTVDVNEHEDLTRR